MHKHLLFFLMLITSCQTQNVQQTEDFDKDFKTEMYNNSSVFQLDKLIDGDTFWVLNHKKESVKIRLIGIDAPEVKNVFRKKKHPFGAESKRYLDSLLISNRYLKLTFDVDSLDQYGRTLSYAFLNDGTFLNKYLVKNGYATLMTVSPNVKYEKEFVAAQEYARENKLGFWRLND